MQANLLLLFDPWAFEFIRILTFDDLSELEICEIYLTKLVKSIVL